MNPVLVLKTDVKTGPPSEVPQGKGQLEAEAKRAAAMLEEFEAQEGVQRDWEKKYYESQRKLEQFKVCAFTLNLCSVSVCSSKALYVLKQVVLLLCQLSFNSRTQSRILAVKFSLTILHLYMLATSSDFLIVSL